LESVEDGLRKTSNKERKTMKTGSATQLKKSGSGPVEPLGALTHDGITEISSSLRQLLADVFALYLKTKNFHWHMTGPHFRDYHLLLDEQATQIFAMTDDIAERARKIGGDTLRSIGDIAKNQRLKDSDDSSLSPKDMLAELRTDNGELTRFLRLAHEICERDYDVATASMIEVWIDQTERRTWFLSEIVAAL
jgi:starvation-inducible DNA-binding protein